MFCALSEWRKGVFAKNTEILEKYCEKTFGFMEKVQGYRT